MAVMQAIQKLFGGIRIPWKFLLPFAVIIGVYTGMVLTVPAFEDTSIRDIGVGFEWWIFFAMVIISNSETPKESAIKTFIFFLISQPIVFLVQPNGIGLLQQYYFDWFIYTLFTFPMAWVGWYTSKEKLYAPCILSFVLIYLTNHVISYVKQHHVFSAVFCIVLFIVLILAIMKNRKLRIIATILGITLGLLARLIPYLLNNQ